MWHPLIRNYLNLGCLVFVVADPTSVAIGCKVDLTNRPYDFNVIGIRCNRPGRNRIALRHGGCPRYFQISVPVQPGNSGGALVDERGNVVGVVSAKLNTAAALSASPDTSGENVNYAVKSSFLLSFLESVPEVSAKLKEPNTKDRKFEDVVKSAEQAAVLVLVY
jgi:hypothetical protein